MARRINAPGIEVNEIDRSSYEETVDNSTIGTATLVLGFGDKGDDYTVRWINTLNTFTRTYGNPTNDAEKYFYNAAAEILNGGGTCYAAKLPYYNDSMDNFVYTSYSISSETADLKSSFEVVTSDVTSDVTIGYDLTACFELHPIISSMCEFIVSAAQYYVDVIGEDSLIGYSQLSAENFSDYREKQVSSLVEAILQLSAAYTQTKTSPIYQESNLGEYYNALSTLSIRSFKIRDHHSLSNLYTLLFFPYTKSDVVDVLVDPNSNVTSAIMEDFVDYIKQNVNFSINEQEYLERTLSSPETMRVATSVLNDILEYDKSDSDSLGLDEPEQISSVNNALRNAFGYETTIYDIVHEYAKTLYLHQFKKYYDELVDGFRSDGKLEVLPDFGDTLRFLDIENTEIKTIDDSLSTFATISADIPSGDELMSFENYDRFLIKQMRPPLNKMYIVDITRGRYEKDTFGNEVMGIMPVVVTPANALFYQEQIKKSNDILSAYNVISKVRNTTRTVGGSISEETKKPFDQQDRNIYSYTPSSCNFVGLGDYLGGEDVVTINDYTVSQYAAEHFPTLKYIEGRLDRQYLSQIGIVVFKLYKDAADNNKISFMPVESFVGSLDRFARDETTGNAIFIDDVVNNNSTYINVFSNANIPEGKDSNPHGLKNASIYLIKNQTACSMGFYERDTRKNIHVSKSIYQPMLKIFEKSEDKNTLDFDLMIDGGVSNIAQFIASTQLYKRNQNDEKTTTFVKDEFQRYGKYDLNDENAYLFKLENPSHTTVWRKVIQRFDDFAKNTRKDILFIADGPRPFCLEGNSKIIRRTRPENTIKKTILPKMKLVSGIINSSYSTGYLNWFWSRDVSSGEYMWMPPSIKAIGVYLYGDNHGAYWDAPAGLNRGRISRTLDVAFNPTNEEAGQIYVNSWNYAISYPLDGIILEGQRTFQRDKTALDRVNVRRLMLGLEKTVRGFCKYFNYEGNTEFNRKRLTDTIERYLEQVRVNDGISQYIVVCDERNNNTQTIENNELHIAIAVRPIKTIEFIVLNFIATNQSVDVEEVMASELGA